MIALALILAVAVVVLVALPFLREPAAADDRLDAPGEAEERRLVLIEERDRALAALKELEFDHRTGKIDDADYRQLVGPLRRSAAAALRALDRPERYGPRMNGLETPELPPEPAPPPDEGTPPMPAPVPEPYPPPDEATVPAPPQE
ncbi:MAG TPA: hypothetical protein VFU56_10285 [Gaiellaceae bacterium]|nr:hypothetical protein [Gaiellaceae bacterium]